MRKRLCTVYTNRWTEKNKIQDSIFRHHQTFVVVAKKVLYFRRLSQLYLRYNSFSSFDAFPKGISLGLSGLKSLMLSLEMCNLPDDYYAWDNKTTHQTARWNGYLIDLFIFIICTCPTPTQTQTHI